MYDMYFSCRWDTVYLIRIVDHRVGGKVRGSIYGLEYSDRVLFLKLFLVVGSQR